MFHKSLFFTDTNIHTLLVSEKRQIMILKDDLTTRIWSKYHKKKRTRNVID